MSADLEQIRRQLGGMPTGRYDLNENEFRIVRHEPPAPVDAETALLNGVVLGLAESEGGEPD